MRIGFIGAGKMGFTLGKHLKDSQLVELVGYYSRLVQSAKMAASFTDTKYYEDLKELVKACDMIFLTVPDGQIEVMAGVLDQLEDLITDKILCHTSGALGSDIFSGMHSRVYGYSVHPIYAVSSKTESYINFKDSFITIEGHERYLDQITNLFNSLGHDTKIINAKDKARYHGSAVMASNLVIGLYHLAKTELKTCGFNDDEADKALETLFIGNANRLVSAGEENALTGPVERCDIKTVSKHLDVFSGESREIYRLLSKQIVEIARVKHGEAGSEEYNKLLDLIG